MVARTGALEAIIEQTMVQFSYQPPNASPPPKSPGS
jgi:hypothetical protein